MKHTTAEAAVSVINSGNRVFIHSVAAAPGRLIQAMTARAHELRDVEIIHLHTEGPAPYAAPDMIGSFRVNALFVGANVRDAIQKGDASYVSIPDLHGFCSLGVSVDCSKAAVQTAKRVVAQVNPNMPRTHGDSMIHVNEIDDFIEVEDALPELPRPLLGDVEHAIGRYCAEMIEDGATLQMGIGAIPDAVLGALTNHKDLGIHTEMFSDGAIELVEAGVINGKMKRSHPGKVVATFVMGTRRVYDFINDNPQISMLDVGYTNDTAVIRRNPRVTAINSAIEVDLTGQVCADSIGTRQYSGVGGQMDFIRGAALSDRGKPIIALPSTTRRGETRIVPFLKQGAGVVSTRAHVHYVVTEHGVANLYGRNLRQRARSLIDIAHPDHREYLEEQAHARFQKFSEVVAF